MEWEEIGRLSLRLENGGLGMNLDIHAETTYVLCDVSFPPTEYSADLNTSQQGQEYKLQE